ncbi:MAG TPA: ABC transporter ATP-binding protein [Actinomycetota bacterium]|nr:ABC transporter ATP-binding protein [Actinomycetota bacterium]
MPTVEVEHVRREFRTGRGLRKRGPVVVALDDVSLTMESGEILGLLGPNGAGKTTLVKVLATVLLPSSGTARVLGHDVVRDTQAVRPLIGIVFGGERGLYNRLTPEQNLSYWAALYKLDPRTARERVPMLLEKVGLAGRTERVETFSRGMKQRLHLARGLISDPPVLFLDEPTTGMDPVASRQFRELVRELRSEGRTIFLTTHDMAEAEDVCDRVALIDRGRLLRIERTKTLRTWLAAFERIDVEGASPEALDAVGRIDGVTKVARGEDGSARIEVGSREALQAALRALVSSGVDSVATSLPSLEDVYLHVFGDRGLNV